MNLLVDVDNALMHAQLGPWLAEHFPGAAGELHVEQLAGGASNPMFRARAGLDEARSHAASLELVDVHARLHAVDAEGMGHPRDFFANVKSCSLDDHRRIMRDNARELTQT